MTADATARPRSARVLAVVDLVVAVLVLAAIWGALPARWWPVDVLGTLLALVLGAGGVGLWLGTRWGTRLALAGGVTVLAAGLLLTTALAWTAAHVAGLYGPVGGGGAVLLFTIAALLLPYLVILPAAQIVLLRRLRER